MRKTQEGEEGEPTGTPRKNGKKAKSKDEKRRTKRKVTKKEHGKNMNSPKKSQTEIDGGTATKIM